MTNDHENAHRPLPVVLRPVADELLSSWLVRHAAYYGVTGSFFAQWLMLGTHNLSTLDHRLGLAQVARLSEKFRCDPVTLTQARARKAARAARSRASSGRRHSIAPVTRVSRVPKQKTSTRPADRFAECANCSRPRE